MAIDKKFPDPIGGGSFIIAYRAKEKHVLVVGGGAVAAGRVFNALDSDMHVTVLSPEINDELQYRCEKGQITWVKDIFREEYLQDVDMVLSTIDDPVESKEIVALCRERKIFVNAADINDLCDFWFMSTHRDGPLQIAVSTNSRAPRLANRIRRQIGTLLPEGTGKAIDNIGELRSNIRKIDPSPNNARKRMTWLTELCDFWSMDHLAKLEYQDIQVLLQSYVHQADVKTIQLRAIDAISKDRVSSNHADDSGSSGSLETFENNDSDTRSIDSKSTTTDSLDVSQNNTSEIICHKAEAREISSKLLQFQNLSISPKTIASYSIDTNCISRSNSNAPPKGKVILIGAGLGDPDLLTIQATKYLQEADLILADRLIPKPIFSCIKKGEIFVARKYPGLADAAQNELNERGLVALKEGKVVVRLKQGDPFVYGRAGEEILFFESHGFECTIVPGLSSALTAACLNRIPVTHRGVADQVLILSGNNRFNQLPEVPNYLKTRTLVFLMVVKKLDPVCELLLKGGYPPELPVSILENASCPNQRRVKGTISTIVDISEKAGANLPALLLVGWSNNVIPDFGTEDIETPKLDAPKNIVDTQSVSIV